MTDCSKTDLERMICQLAPWHHKVQVSSEIFTGGGRTADDTGTGVALIDPLEIFDEFTAGILPQGMQGRSFLDCGCNCGGFSFAAKDRGAGKVYGFDVRQHWIDQANFIAHNRVNDSSGMGFARADLQHLNTVEEDFDITWFSGLLYHLPDPVAGLKLAADRTKEIIFLNTAILGSEPDDVEQPSLSMKTEGTSQLMSGVDGLSWLPSGPVVLCSILKWLGFPETRTLWWIRKWAQDRNPHAITTGRILIVAARDEGRFSDVEKVEPVALEQQPFR